MLLFNAERRGGTGETPRDENGAPIGASHPSLCAPLIPSRINNRTESRTACLWVARASRLPYFASRGIHADTSCIRYAFGCPRCAGRDAQHGRRDARATRCTPPAFSGRRLICGKWYLLLCASAFNVCAARQWDLPCLDLLSI